MSLGDYEFRDPVIENLLRQIAGKIAPIMPPGWGFAFFLMETGKEDGNTFYIANVERADFLDGLQKFIDRERKRNESGAVPPEVPKSDKSGYGTK